MPPALQLCFAILAAIEFVLLAAATAHAVMWRREPRSAALWIAISILVPLGGPLAYFVLGINRTVRRARRKLKGRAAAAAALAACSAEARASAVGPLDSLARLGDEVTTEPLVDGNLLEPLWNGEEAFPAMLEAINGARRSVALCTYIFDVDEIGNRFAEALAAAAKRGVPVKLLVDGLGSWWWFSKLQRLLRHSKLLVRTFDPMGFTPSRLLHFNLRNHRKILVVDGETAFSGGINVSARHLAADSARPGCCRDLHFRLRGPVVASLMRAFADDWLFAAGETLSGEDWFPPLAPAGTSLARGIPSGPDANIERIYWVLSGACQTAQKSIRIVTPYFIPEQGLRHALMAASLRGVRVHLILPEVSDHRPVAWATRSYLWELLMAGVAVSYTPAPFDHSKLVLVDDRWALFGSANLDPRSLRLNFEYNVEAYDPGLVKVLEAHFDGLVAKGRKVTLKEMDGRSGLVRLRDGLSKLFSPYL
ncbi:MAG: cardiolipin synthase [Planctomycetes bacterium]|nr:cardiolipin synthase [Planctomycetota bacterium]